MTDPCSCDVMCEHGHRCFGGHANYPSSHWYACGSCTPKKATIFILSDRRMLAVMTPCAHAVGPFTSGRTLVLATREHHQTCKEST